MWIICRGLRALLRSPDGYGLLCRTGSLSLRVVQAGCFCFLFVMVANNALYHSIDIVWRKYIPITVGENEAAVAINFRLIESSNLLSFVLLRQGVLNILEHRDDPYTSFGFWCGNVELTRSAILLPIDKVMIDRDKVLLKIAVFPSKTNNFTNSAACSKQHRKQRHPMRILAAIGTK